MSATNFAYGLIYNLALPSVQFKLILIVPITTVTKKNKKNKNLTCIYLFIIFFFSEKISLDISGESSAADDILILFLFFRQNKS